MPVNKETRFFTYQKSNDEVSFHGIDDGRPGVLQEWSNGCISIKIPGHNYYYVGGGTRYIPTSYQVWRVINSDDNGEVMSGTVEFVTSFPARKFESKKRRQ